MKRGYTLVEVIVSIAVFSILMGVTITAFRGVGAKDRIKAANSQVLSLMRQTRNAAFNGIVDSSGSYPAGGYGLYFDVTAVPNQITLFADRNNNRYFDASEAQPPVISLDGRVRLVLAKNNGQSVTKMSVMFQGDDILHVYDQGRCPLPPEGEFCFPVALSQGLILTLRDANLQDSCTVKIKVSPNLSTDKSLYITSSASQC